MSIRSIITKMLPFVVSGVSLGYIYFIYTYIIRKITKYPDTEKDYWLVAYFHDKKDADKYFDISLKYKRPILFFKSTISPGWIVAVYTTDDIESEKKIKYNAPTPDESYAGLVRVFECLRMHILLRYVYL